MARIFLNFVEKAVVHEQHLDGWEFGKGALSAAFHGAAVLQSCSAAVQKGKGGRLRSRLEVRGWRLRGSGKE